MDTDEKEKTCIRLAAEYNQVKVVKVILDHMKRERKNMKDLIDQPDQLGFAPLHVAAMHGHTDILAVN